MPFTSFGMMNVSLQKPFQQPCRNTAARFSESVNSKDISITKEQLSWLLSGLKIYQDKCFKEIKIDNENTAI